MGKIFIVTLQFLTRVPINKNYIIGKDELAKGVVFFSAIGLIIGGFNFAVYELGRFISTGILPLVLALFANVLITGGLHIDGLADACDGLFSARDKKRMLEIMKDSHIGTNGVLAIVFDFLFRLAILSELPSRVVGMAILLSPVVAKSLVAYYIVVSEDAREGKGMGSFFMGGIRQKYTAVAMAIGAVIVFAIGRQRGIFALLLAFAALFPLMSFIKKKIGGATGDIFGGANEIMEIAFIFFFLVAGRIGL